ncbi:MAG: TetR/AcrR family transcriptional regulator [Nocardioidaceae bacterium]
MARQRIVERSETIARVKQVARRHLVEHGVAGVQLPAIARELSMPVIEMSKYVASLDALLVELVADLWGELADAIEEATLVSSVMIWDRLVDGARALRRWAITYPQEFRLLFGISNPAATVLPDAPYVMSGHRFGDAFGVLFVELWETRGFPTDPLEPELEEAMRQYSERVGLPLPPEAVAVFVGCWTRLYGAITLDVLGHVSLSAHNAERLFERELVSIGIALGATADDLLPRTDRPADVLPPAQDTARA